jgi:hypothetical protein
VTGPSASHLGLPARTSSRWSSLRRYLFFKPRGRAGGRRRRIPPGTDAQALERRQCLDPPQSPHIDRYPQSTARTESQRRRCKSPTSTAELSCIAPRRSLTVAVTRSGRVRSDRRPACGQLLRHLEHDLFRKLFRERLSGDAVAIGAWGAEHRRLAVFGRRSANLRPPGRTLRLNGFLDLRGRWLSASPERKRPAKRAFSFDRGDRI